jgi:hypothetical protein
MDAWPYRRNLRRRPASRLYLSTRSRQLHQLNHMGRYVDSLLSYSRNRAANFYECSHWTFAVVQHRQAILRPSSLLLDRRSFTNYYFLSQEILSGELIPEVNPLASVFCRNRQPTSCSEHTLHPELRLRMLRGESQTGINYTTAFAVSLIFNKIIKSRYKHWCEYPTVFCCNRIAS